MLYAREVEELMAAYPGREFKPMHIIRHVARGRKLDRRERHAMRVSVWRVLQAFVAAGVIAVRPAVQKQGAPAYYTWKVSHDPLP